MKTKLEQIETALQSFIEGDLASLLPWGNTENLLAHQLVEAMQANLITTPSGVPTAPVNYLIHMHPSRLHFWQKNPGYLERLAKALYQAGVENGVHFTVQPALYLAADLKLNPDETRVSVGGQPPEKIAETAVVEVAPAHHEVATEPVVPPNAFLIIDGSQNYPLRQAVVNIGRRLENHIVLNDPRVSRSHAQLRAVRGVYYLFDLNATGGTFVNGQRISQAALKPGDVISLAGVTLIYGQDIPAPAADDTGATPVVPLPHQPPKETDSDS